MNDRRGRRTKEEEVERKNDRYIIENYYYKHIDICYLHKLNAYARKLNLVIFYKLYLPLKLIGTFSGRV